MIVTAAALESLVQVVVVAVVAGVGVTVIFSLAIVGAVRSSESRREQRRRISLAWGVLATVAVIGVLAAVVAGMRVVAN